jgi:SAM-dependent methyltransferase
MLNRDSINKLRYVLEDVMPAFVRDSRLFYGLMWLMYRDRTRYFTDFRVRSPHLTRDEYEAYYRAFPALLEQTDLNQACIERIVAESVGDTAIDVGCGRGYFADVLRRRTGKQVTGVDFIVPQALREKYPEVTFVEGAIEKLPFADQAFDTVICSHTLEHITQLSAAVAELRRICRQRLILVVPREREYRYGFNMHVNFFPYPHSLLNRLHPLPARHRCEVVDGDLLYVEDRDAAAAAGAVD